MKLSDKIYLDYNDIVSMCVEITHDISKINPDIVVGITRGGLLPALHVSHQLNRPMTTIRWQTRDNQEQEHNDVLKQMIRDKKTVVFVDDINDTGRTFKELNMYYNGDGDRYMHRDNTHFISLIKRLGTEYDAPASLTLDDERWLVFPWEKV